MAHSAKGQVADPASFPLGLNLAPIRYDSTRPRFHPGKSDFPIPVGDHDNAHAGQYPDQTFRVPGGSGSAQRTPPAKRVILIARSYGSLVP